MVLRGEGANNSRMGRSKYSRHSPREQFHAMSLVDGDDIELKARSQPTRTRFSARMSDGRDLGPCLVGADVLLSRSPLSVRSTNMGLEIIPSVLGNDGREIRTIEQSAVPTIASSRYGPAHQSLPSLRARPTNEQNCSRFLLCEF